MMVHTTKPLAFQVILGGMRPLTMEIDYQLGMKTLGHTVAQKWSTAAQDLVLNIWSKSPDKLAILKDWQMDKKGRAHGTLVLKGFQKDIVLNDVLAAEGHGAFYQDLLKTDLQAKTVRVIGPRFTSICGPGSARGTITLDASVDFANMDLNLLNPSPAEADDSEEIQERPPPDKDWMSFIPQEKLNKAIRRNTKKLEYYKCRSNATSMNTSLHSSFQEGDVSLNSCSVKKMTKLEWIKARQRQKPNDNNTENEKSEPSIWDEYRNIPEFIDSDEDDDDRASRKRRMEQKQRYEDRMMCLPAGIDIGKYIETALKRMPEVLIGPKQIIPALLKKSPKTAADKKKY
jgi:hypothetical protein